MFANYRSSSYSCYNTIWTQGKCLIEWSICCSSTNTGFQIPKTFIRPGKTQQVSVIPVLGRQKQGLLGKDAWVDQLELMSSSFNGILCINKKKNVEDYKRHMLSTSGLHSRCIHVQRHLKICATIHVWTQTHTTHTYKITSFPSLNVFHIPPKHPTSSQIFCLYVYREKNIIHQII